MRIRTASASTLLPLALLALLLLSASVAEAHIYSGAPPACDRCSRGCPAPCLSAGSSISLTEGILRDRVNVARIKSATGPTIDFFLSYYDDRSLSAQQTVVGTNWTHSYNILLFRQLGNMFRMDAAGRFIKYLRQPDGTFISPPGYFETLVQNPDGTFTLRQKDGTVFDFAEIPGTHFRLSGPLVFRLTRIADRNNNTTTLSYTGGDLTEITDTYGRSLTLTYDGRNKLEFITDPLGRTTRLEYSPNGRKLIRITDPEGKSITYHYSGLNLRRKIDKDGRVFSYVYGANVPVAVKDGARDTLFRLTNTQKWGVDRRRRFHDRLLVYLPATTVRTDGRGNVWTYDYDEHAYITRIVAPDGAPTSYTYDPATLLVASVTDANTHSTFYEYDALGNRTKVTNALGHITTFTYEPVFSQMTSMTDSNGRVTLYEYDSFGNRTKETDPLGNTRQWTYDANGNILTQRDKNGNLTQHQYDAFGNRIKTTDAVGRPEQRQTAFTYDAVGNLLTRTDANGHATTFAYDSLDRLIQETDPLGCITITFYDGEGNRIQVIDSNGNPTSFEYDLRKRLIKTIDALGQETTQFYDGNNNLTFVSDKNRHTTAFEYDVQNRLTRIIDALGNLTTRTFDPVGNLLTETDANNHTTRYEYDALNRRIKKTDAVSCITLFEYDRVGLSGCAECTGPTRGSSLVTRQTDGNGKVTHFKYDGLDRLIIQIRKEGDTADVIDPSDAVTRLSYDPNGNRLSVTEPNGNTTTSEYDALNRRIREMNAAGDVTRFTYDGVGNVIRIFAPNGNVTTNTYDPKNRLIRVEDLVGLVAIYTYDCVGNRLSETDGNGNTTEFRYDAIYRLVQVIDPLRELTDYEYDPVGNLIRVIDREDNETTHTYDDINRRLRTIDSLGNATDFQYDGVGNLIRIIDANNNPTDYDYDSVNRLIKKTYADGVPNTRTFTYDCVGNLLTRTDQSGQTTIYTYNDLYFLTRRTYPRSPSDMFTYDLSGRMLTAERGGWLVTFDYDGANRVTRTTQNGKTIRYVYDIPGRTRRITYPGGRVVIEQMDFRDRLDRIDGPGIIGPPIVQYSYDLGNRVGSRTYRNGTLANYTYNANNWVLELEHSLGATRIAGFGHAHDKEGNKKLEEKRHDTTRSEEYQYDKIYRLINFKVGQLVGSTVPVPLTQTQYNLDPVGNWNSKVTDGVTETRIHNEANEITKIDAVDLFYDDNSNLREDERFIYDYDEENRLIRAMRKSDNRVVGQYQYDSLGRRVVKIANLAGTLTETHYFYDDARIIEEQNATGVTQATYVYGNYIDEVLTIDRGGQTFFYHQNTLWSVAAITDNAADVVERYTYDAYGCVTTTSTIGNPYLFTGRQLDEETGLYYYRARYYDCAKGRFLQRDPLGFVDGMNLYEYVRGRPSLLVDPLGLENGKIVNSQYFGFGTEGGDLTGRTFYTYDWSIKKEFNLQENVFQVIVNNCQAKGIPKDTETKVKLGLKEGVTRTVSVESGTEKTVKGGISGKKFSLEASMTASIKSGFILQNQSEITKEIEHTVTLPCPGCAKVQVWQELDKTTFTGLGSIYDEWLYISYARNSAESGRSNILQWTDKGIEKRWKPKFEVKTITGTCVGSKCSFPGELY